MSPWQCHHFFFIKLEAKLNLFNQCLNANPKGALKNFGAHDKKKPVRVDRILIISAYLDKQSRHMFFYRYTPLRRCK